MGGGWGESGGGVRNSLDISGNFPGDLDRDGEGPSVQKMIL